MATNTSTVTLFLERRENSEHKYIANAVKAFFDTPKDVTVLEIEKAFSKYFSCVFDNITLDDYICFVNQNYGFSSEELYEDYCSWFDKQTDVQKLKTSKFFQSKSEKELKKILAELLYQKMISIEKEKITYFLLSYGQKTIITKAGEKQDEKAFLGYEFSKSRGHESIKMLPEGTKLYDKFDQFNSEKANYYVYSAFQKSYPDIDEALQENIESIETYELVNFRKLPLEKSINLNANVRVNFDTTFPKERLRKSYDIIKGITYDKND